MPAPELDAYEQAAALEAGDKAGAYLDQIGVTDLAKLSETEWQEFLRRILRGFEQSLRQKILNGVAPF